MNPDVSVITVNYNGLADTCRMIESLRRHTRTSYEIIVVDNASQQDEAAALRERYPGITVLQAPRNLGFAGGNNLGIRAARGRYFMLLNNDTLVEEEMLAPLCERLDNDPGLGAVCPKIRFAQDGQPIQFAGYTRLSAVTLRNRLIGFGEPDRGQYQQPHDTPYAHGAAMMVRREAVERAGEMPEMYFLYYEELDWSLRIREHGYRIGYEPRATVFHRESRSTGADSPLRTFYLTRNRLLFARRNRRGAQRWLSIAYQLGIALPKSVAVSLLRGRPDLASAALRAAAGFFRLPRDPQ